MCIAFVLFHVTLSMTDGNKPQCSVHLSTMHHRLTILFSIENRDTRKHAENGQKRHELNSAVPSIKKDIDRQRWLYTKVLTTEKHEKWSCMFPMLLPIPCHYSHDQRLMKLERNHGFSEPWYSLLSGHRMGKSSIVGWFDGVPRVLRGWATAAVALFVIPPRYVAGMIQCPV